MNRSTATHPSTIVQCWQLSMCPRSLQEKPYNCKSNIGFIHNMFVTTFEWPLEKMHSCKYHNYFVLSIFQILALIFILINYITMTKLRICCSKCVELYFPFHFMVRPKQIRIGQAKYSSNICLSFCCSLSFIFGNFHQKIVSHKTFGLMPLPSLILPKGSKIQWINFQFW